MKKYMIMSLSLMLLVLVGCSSASPGVVNSNNSPKIENPTNKTTDSNIINSNDSPKIENPADKKTDSNIADSNFRLSKYLKLKEESIKSSGKLSKEDKENRDNFIKSFKEQKNISFEDAKKMVDSSKDLEKIKDKNTRNGIKAYYLVEIVEKSSNIQEIIKKVPEFNKEYEALSKENEEDYKSKKDEIFKKYDKEISEMLQRELPEVVKAYKNYEDVMKKINPELSIDKKFLLSVPAGDRTKKEIKELKNQVEANKKRIEEVSKENRQGIALTTAMAQINPLGMNEGKFSAGVGMGYFKGETGLAFGVGYGISEGISLSSKGAFATGDFKTFAIGAGMNFEF